MVAKAYHPVALYNTMGKTVSAVMTDMLVYLTVWHNLLPAKCFRGLPGHTMTDSLLYLINNIKNVWRWQQVATIIFLDIAGTFPNAVTTRLLANMVCLLHTMLELSGPRVLVGSGQVRSGSGFKQTWLQRAGCCADLSFMSGI